jgi:hypothetical protein
MKKKVFTVCVDNYFPELVEITLPTFNSYASKIGAELVVITERKYVDWPPTYEKLQIWDLGRDSDWNIFIDADTVISPAAPDFTNSLPMEIVGLFAGFEASTQFIMDQYFIRDGRDRGISGGLLVTSSWTHDLWTPLELPWQEAKNRLIRKHCIDEYCTSRNLAKFGLKYVGLLPYFQDMARQFFHLGAMEQDKERILKLAKAHLERSVP